MRLIDADLLLERIKTQGFMNENSIEDCIKDIIDEINEQPTITDYNNATMDCCTCEHCMISYKEEPCCDCIRNAMSDNKVINYYKEG